MGNHLARMLSGSGHEITVIDSDQKLLSEVENLAEVITIEGDTTTFAVLRKAGVRRCDLFIAVNHDENQNILAAIMAKQLGAKKSIARIDNNEYLEPNNKEMFIDMGIDYLFYPEQVAAKEVANLLGYTTTTDYVDFSGGLLSLVVFRLEPTSPLVGRKLMDLAADGSIAEFRVVAIARGSQTIIPRGQDEFFEGDVVYIIARKDVARSVTELSGQKSVEVKNLMILGGSRIGVRVALELQQDMNVKMVEYNGEKAYRLAEVLEFIVKPNSPATKCMIKDMRLPQDVIIGGIVRGDKVFIAVGDTQINAYDRVVVFSMPGSISTVGEFFN